MARSKAGRGTLEQRASVRFDTRMPVQLAGGTGTTHNISARGVYFETDVQPVPGALVDFTIEYHLRGRMHRLLCEGKVVRVEAQARKTGVAARLIGPIFDSEEDVAPAPPR
ncbi:PilZ domain-containing protein [Ramlibacter ginsenosidimutans]|uniref:PilZ domain-containing protein n=1 Tax=Ramlibacter ginsenosidimutans TaxID=502333 RepID=A0A934TS61_9BURK|nr:PilZ domain-containing protein [Ramlibacter ginsenosidimutans]MBK6006569.1 PilZ domain-containing protein [Ramlibacter ginsenosidimutans]